MFVPGCLGQVFVGQGPLHIDMSGALPLASLGSLVCCTGTPAPQKPLVRLTAKGPERLKGDGPKALASESWGDDDDAGEEEEEDLGVMRKVYITVPVSVNCVGIKVGSELLVYRQEGQGELDRLRLRALRVRAFAPTAATRLPSAGVRAHQCGAVVAHGKRQRWWAAGGGGVEVGSSVGVGWHRTVCGRHSPPHTQNRRALPLAGRWRQGRRRHFSGTSPGGWSGGWSGGCSGRSWWSGGGGNWPAVGGWCADADCISGCRLQR